MLFCVVPYVGTWIEMCVLMRKSPRAPVVPYVGTWIEMSSLMKWVHMIDGVVPYVGTWIEMWKRDMTCRRS